MAPQARLQISKPGKGKSTEPGVTPSECIWYEANGPDYQTVYTESSFSRPKNGFTKGWSFCDA